jgi:putative transposase
MSRYRRATGGSTFFFTLVSFQRRPILCDEAIRAALRKAIRDVRAHHPFSIDALVLLPDHLHCIWTLPVAENDYSTRWSRIKRNVSWDCRAVFHDDGLLTPSARKRREVGIWQRRFWEHRIRNDADFERHVDYIHYNPVRHGYAAHASEWPYSTFRQYVQRGLYAPDWGGVPESGAIGE